MQPNEHVGGPSDWVLVPAVVLDEMGDIEETYLRLVLAFSLAEHREGQRGVFVELGELARSIGRSETLTKSVLAELKEKRRVKSKGDAWSLTPFYPRRLPSSE